MVQSLSRSSDQILETLCLNNMVGITRRSFQSIQQFKKLTTLNLTGIKMDPVEAIDFGVFETLCLKSFTLQNCQYMNDEILSKLLYSNPIEYLNIDGSANVTDLTMELLVSSNVLRLSISRCPRITCTSLCLFLERCSDEFIFLDISANSWVDYAVLRQVIKKKTLEMLNISSCSQLLGYQIYELNEKQGRPFSWLKMDNCNVSNDTINCFRGMFGNVSALCS